MSGGADEAWFAQNGAGGAEQRRSTKFAARVHATGCDAAIDLREGRGNKILLRGHRTGPRRWAEREENRFLKVGAGNRNARTPCATFPRTRAPSRFQLHTSGTLATKSSHMWWESLEASVPCDGALTMIWRCFLRETARNWARSSLFADVRSFRVDRSLPVRLVGVTEDTEHLRGDWRLRGRPRGAERVFPTANSANHRGSTAVRCAALRVSLAACGSTGLTGKPHRGRAMPGHPRERCFLSQRGSSRGLASLN